MVFLGAISSAKTIARVLATLCMLCFDTGGMQLYEGRAALSTTLLSISYYFSKRGSQVCCQLANYVSKFGSWAGTSQQSSQVHFKVRTLIVNICS
jgi:hypothetical protein